MNKPTQELVRPSDAHCLVPHFADRQYGEEEDARRYEVFVQNVQKIEAHNKEFLAKKTSFSMDISLFTDQVCTKPGVDHNIASYASPALMNFASLISAFLVHSIFLFVQILFICKVTYDVNSELLFFNLSL